MICIFYTYENNKNRNAFVGMVDREGILIQNGHSDLKQTDDQNHFWRW